jgi:hypothetical protein
MLLGARQIFLLLLLAVASGCTKKTVPAPEPMAPQAPMEPSRAPQKIVVPQPSPDAPRDAVRQAALHKDTLDLMNAFENREARWSPDHRMLAFLSNRSGNWRAYVSEWRVLDLPPSLVPSPKGNIVDLAYLPCGLVLLSQHEGKRRLTVSTSDFTGFQSWGPEMTASTIPWRATTKADGVVIPTRDTVYFGSSQAPLRHQVALDSRFRVMDSSPDGRRVLLLENVPAYQAKVAELDWTGRWVDIFQASEAMPVHRAIYASDGESVLLAVNPMGFAVDEKPSRILRKTKREQPTEVFSLQDPSAQILQMVNWSRSPSMAVLVQSQKGRHVYVGSSIGQSRFERVELPLGWGNLGAYSANGHSLTVTWETPEAPSDIWEVSTARHHASKKLREDIRPVLARFEDLRWHWVEVSASLKGAVYEPANAPRGILLLLGEKGYIASWRPAVRFLVGMGFGVITPSDPLTSWQELGEWMSWSETWVKQRGWSLPMAVLARASEASFVVETMGKSEIGSEKTALSWDLMLEPAPKAWELKGTWDGKKVLVAGAREEAEPWVRDLRSQGAQVEYAACERSECWAREVLFLERLISSSSKESHVSH